MPMKLSSKAFRRSTLPHLFPTGRVYLSKSPALLKLLTDSLKAEEKDSPSRQNALVALQKLSLR